MEKVETCVKKVGLPDLLNGMHVCGKLCFYANAGDTVGGMVIMYTGWRHVDNADQTHHAVPESWVR
jgi:hypothetical protein